MVRRGALCLGAGVLLVLLAGAADAQQPAIQPVTLATGGLIQSFGQDGEWIAWIDSREPCSRRVRLRRVSGGPMTFLTRGKGPACSDGYSYGHRMALAGRRAAWIGVIGGNTVLYVALWASSPEREVDSFDIPNDEVPFHPLPLAGDGPSLVFAYPRRYESARAGPPEAARLARGGDERIPGTVGTFLVAVHGTTLAAARAVPGCDVCVGSPSWSADGSRLQFVSRGDAYVMDADGANARRVGIEASGTWAPRGRAIMLEDSDRGRPALVFYDADSQVRRVLVRGETLNPTWSPDGSQIAFRRDNGLYTVGTGGGLRRLLSGKVGSFQWSPDSARLAVGTGPTLAVVPARGGRAVSVVSGAYGGFAWSPRSDRIAYEVERAGKKTLEVALRDGSSQRRILTADVIQFLPEWSPDGTRLAFLGRDGVYVAAADGAGLRRLAAGEPYDYPRWSPDGRWLAFVLQEGEAYGVYAAEQAGPARRLASLEDPRFGSLLWSPSSRLFQVEPDGILAPTGGIVARLPVSASSLAWSPDGRQLAYVRQTEPAGLVVGDETGASPRVLRPLPTPVPAWNGVELRSLVGTASTVRFAVDGLPTAVALSRTRVAVLVERARRKRIDVHARNGRLERSFAVPRSTSADLGTSGRWVVYRVGKAIWALDAATGRSRLLATAKETPVGLSIEGNRVAWAEQTEPSRIRAVSLEP